MSYTNLNTAAFDGRGRIWLTGQNGIYGRLAALAELELELSAFQNRNMFGKAPKKSGPGEMTVST
jgi:virginiamycin B lyase